MFDFPASASTKNGDQPTSNFVAVGSVLYGMTSEGGKDGGATGDGTIFSFDTSCATYKRLYSFDGGHGSDPHGQLILDPNGNTFYGMTRSGGNVAIRSSPGAGTEVALSMSREPGRRARSARAT